MNYFHNCKPTRKLSDATIAHNHIFSILMILDAQSPIRLTQHMKETSFL